MALENEIQEAIRKSLPAQVADTLRGELARLAAVENNFNDLMISWKTLNAENAEIKRINAGLLKDIQGYSAREDALRQREANTRDAEQKIMIAGMKQDSAEQKVELVKDMFNTVFANNVIKTRVAGTVPGGVMQPTNINGFIQSGGAVQASVDTTTEVTG